MGIHTKILEVPYVLQPRKGNFCGAACAKMVLDAQGRRKRSVRALGRALGITPGPDGGVEEECLAAWLAREGAQVTFIRAWLDGPPRIAHYDDEDMRRAVQRIVARRSTTDWRAHCYGEILSHGGTVLPRPPRMADLVASLQRGVPPIVSFAVHALRGPKAKRRKWQYRSPKRTAAVDADQEEFSKRLHWHYVTERHDVLAAHYVVVRGIVGDEVVINDSGSRTWDRKSIPLEALMTGIHMYRGALISARWEK